MGYRLLTQAVLIIASLVVIFSFVQPSFGEIEKKQEELAEYRETIERASEFNAKLRQLIQRSDSFSRQDIQALERFVPTKIDSLKVMSEIAGIFSGRNITVTSMTAQQVVDPLSDVSLDDGILAEAELPNLDLSYQDYEVMFVANYQQMREILMLTEASNSLLEVVELSFDTTQIAEVDREGDAVAALQTQEDMIVFKLILRTYGLPVTTN